MPAIGPQAFSLEQLEAVLQKINQAIADNRGFEERGMLFVPLEYTYGDLTKTQQEQIANAYQSAGWSKAWVEHGTLHDDQYWLGLAE